MVYSIANLQQERETVWSGVRNYQARNFLRQMNQGDLAFFYHSNTTPPGIVGLMRVVTPNIADPTQFDSNSRPLAEIIRRVPTQSYRGQQSNCNAVQTAAVDCDIAPLKS